MQDWAYLNVVDREGKEIDYLPLENLDKLWNSVQKEKLKNESMLHLKWKKDNKDYKCDIPISIKCKKTKDKLIRFIKLHMSLKDQRNKTNHASKEEKRVSVQNLKKALETYAAWAEELGIR